MAVSRKKVVVRQFDGGLTWGYLPASVFVVEDGVEVLDPAGRVKSCILSEIKTIAYVRDFNLEDQADPERMGRRAFLGRPRADGLWLKLTFRDGDVLEGLAHLDAGFLDSLLEDRGLHVAPPDARSNTLRVFVPRAALSAVEVLGYVGVPAKKKAAEQVLASAQGGLFGE